MALWLCLSIIPRIGDLTATRVLTITVAFPQNCRQAGGALTGGVAGAPLVLHLLTSLPNLRSHSAGVTGRSARFKPLHSTVGGLIASLIRLALFRVEPCCGACSHSSSTLAWRFSNPITLRWLLFSLSSPMLPLPLQANGNLGDVRPRKTWLPPFCFLFKVRGSFG